MIIKDDITYKGFTYNEIKKNTEIGYSEFKEIKKEIILWNKIVKILKKNNVDLYKEFKNVELNRIPNYIKATIKKIIYEIKYNNLDLNNISSILFLENGSRGLSRTMTCIILDKNEQLFLTNEELYFK